MPSCHHPSHFYVTPLSTIFCTQPANNSILSARPGPVSVTRRLAVRFPTWATNIAVNVRSPRNFLCPSAVTGELNFANEPRPKQQITVTPRVSPSQANDIPGTFSVPAFHHLCPFYLTFIDYRLHPSHRESAIFSDATCQPFSYETRSTIEVSISGKEIF